MIKLKQYLSEKSVAEMLSISPSRLRMDRHYKRGLPYVKITKTVRYDLADIERYLAEHTIEHLTE